MIKHEKQKGTEAIWLKSMVSSPACGFYRKLGFADVKTERLPYEGFKEEFRDILVMNLVL